VRSSSIRPEEEQLRSTLEEIEDELKRGRTKGKLNELWALLGAVNAAKERARSGSGEWAVVDEDGLAQLTQASIHFISLLPFSCGRAAEAFRFLYPISCALLLINDLYLFSPTSFTDSIRTTSGLDSPDQDTS
jgi:hypothetical protein